MNEMRSTGRFLGNYPIREAYSAPCDVYLDEHYVVNPTRRFPYVVRYGVELTKGGAVAESAAPPF